MDNENVLNDILDGKKVKVDRKTKKAAKKLVKNNLGGITSLVKDLSNSELSDAEMQNKFNDFMFGMLGSLKKDDTNGADEVSEFIPDKENNSDGSENVELSEMVGEVLEEVSKN